MSSMKLATAFILTEASNEEIKQLMESIKIRRETLGRFQRRTLKVGALVKFTHRNIEYRGKVTDIRVKKATVSVTSPIANIYNVPLNMLEAA